jgi:hypothetical protein
VSGNNNTATLIGSASYNATGAFSLGSTGVINAPMTKTANCAFECWANQTSAFGSQMLFNAGPNGQGPDIYFNNGFMMWNIWDGTTNQFGIIPANANNGSYHHYVLVNDASSTAKLYYDGALYGTAAYHSAANNTNLVIGGAAADGSAPQFNWLGSIASFKVYSRVLSVTEITQNFNANRGRYGI